MINRTSSAARREQHTATETDETAVWAYANTGNRAHAFLSPAENRPGYLRAACRKNIERAETSIFHKRETFVLICHACETKWDAHRARVEESTAPMQPCESFETYGAAPMDVATAEDIQAAGEELFAPRRSDRRATRRKAAQLIRARKRQHRANSRISRRKVGTLATHAVAAGLDIRSARSAAGTMRKCAERVGVLGTAGTSYRARAKARACTRYSRTEAALICQDYAKRARKAEFKAMAARVIRAAAFEVAA
ncbi:hypothetical protein [Streptomyces sp. NPDC101115]|uniref:hypothetical protein n=1 Tax=Streptomyces sp. NPDC101115 TaxID=3366106 RepID=UPI0037F9933C